MKLRLLTPLFLAVLMTSGQAQKIRVACLGDSITYGAGITAPGTSPATWEGDKYQLDGPTLLDQDSYPEVLQSLLGDGYDVRNFGGSGRTVTGPGAGLFPYLNSTRDSNTPSGGFTSARAFDPDVVLIMLGTNDTKTALWPTSLPRFKADYINLVQTIQNWPNKPYVVICYPIPVEDSPKPNPASGITESNRQLLLPLINEVIAETGAGFINTNPWMPAFSGLLSDQVHPNRAGAAKIAGIMDAGFPIVTRTGTGAPWTVRGTRPVVALSSPADRSVLLTSGTVTVSATAEPETVTGTGIGAGAPTATILPITKVEFFVDGRKFGEATSAPYEAPLSGLAPGTYTLTASATNSAGLQRTSAPRTLFVSAQPLAAGGMPFIDEYVETFDTLVREVKAATVPWQNDSTLPGWSGATLTSGKWTAASAHQGDDGSSNTQVLKSLGPGWGRNRSLGIISTNLTTWGVCLRNAGTETITHLTIRYTGEQWRVSATAANNKPLNVEFSTTATSLGSSSGFTAIPTLQFSPPTTVSAVTTKLDGKLPANRTVRQATFAIPGGWPPGGTLWLRWVTGAAQSSTVALDDLAIVAGTGAPERPALAREETGLRLFWDAVGGLTYSIEFSPDLTEWNVLASGLIVSGLGRQLASHPVILAENTPRQFFRVRRMP